VMNQGKIEEIDHAHAIYKAPKTDYTRKLISSIPIGTIDRIIHQQSNRVIEN
jgi:peptide/nickel transport system ATP-binding protein